MVISAGSDRYPQVGFGPANFRVARIPSKAPTLRFGDNASKRRGKLVRGRSGDQFTGSSPQ